MDFEKYYAFINSKKIRAEKYGFKIDEKYLPKGLFDWQVEIIKRSCEKGKSAIFASCGLGKTIMQLSWAYQVVNYTNKNVLILAPLAVGKQTVQEGEKFGIKSKFIRSMNDICEDVYIYIMNYEMIDHVNVKLFEGIVLDESSILKSMTGKIRTKLIKQFSTIHYKLCCTATPAPNDFTELGNHSEFLGIKTLQEMLSIWFINDGFTANKWRLKHHAESDFWQWVSSWAISINKPSDLDKKYSDTDFILPKLETIKHQIKDDSIYCTDGYLVKTGSISATSIKREMRNSIEKRIAFAKALVEEKKNESWLIWCELNDESKKLVEEISDSVEITGSMPNEEKAQKMVDFASGKIKILVTKPKNAGFGMNWQICHNVIFVGVSFSFESYYQAIRRCWRFGQKENVSCHVILCNNEYKIFSIIEEKEKKYIAMTIGMNGYFQNEKEDIAIEKDQNIKIKIPNYLTSHGSVA